jgi:hypothetical protein
MKDAFKSRKNLLAATTKMNNSLKVVSFNRLKKLLLEKNLNFSLEFILDEIENEIPTVEIKNDIIPPGVLEQIKETADMEYVNLKVLGKLRKPMDPVKFIRKLKKDFSHGDKR